MAVVKVCLEIPFNKKLCHIEVGQLICKAGSLVSVWYEFSLTGISEQKYVTVWNYTL